MGLDRDRAFDKLGKAMSQKLVQSFVAFDDDSETSLYCDGCGQKLDGNGYILIEDVGGPPPDPDLPTGTVSFYIADTWMACCESCAIDLIANVSIPDN